MRCHRDKRSHAQAVLPVLPTTGARLQVWESDESQVWYDDPLLDLPTRVERLEAVAERLRRLFRHIEAAHSGCTVLLVSHGDALSILCAAATLTPLQRHRRHAFSPGELRQLPQAAAVMPLTAV